MCFEGAGFGGTSPLEPLLSISGGLVLWSYWRVSTFPPELLASFFGAWSSPRQLLANIFGLLVWSYCGADLLL